jgi:hypothetical protein
MLLLQFQFEMVLFEQIVKFYEIALSPASIEPNTVSKESFKSSNSIPTFKEIFVNLPIARTAPPIAAGPLT